MIKKNPFNFKIHRDFYLTLLSSLSNRANEKIAHIRSEANAEGVALNARLRKEQMKVESLERAVVQKVGCVVLKYEDIVKRKIKTKKGKEKFKNSLSWLF